MAEKDDVAREYLCEGVSGCKDWARTTNLGKWFSFRPGGGLRYTDHTAAAAFSLVFRLLDVDLRACLVNSSNNSSRSLFLGMLPTKRRWLFKDGRIAMLFPFRTS